MRDGELTECRESFGLTVKKAKFTWHLLLEESDIHKTSAIWRWRHSRDTYDKKRVTFKGHLLHEKFDIHKTSVTRSNRCSEGTCYTRERRLQDTCFTRERISARHLLQWVSDVHKTTATEDRDVQRGICYKKRATFSKEHSAHENEISKGAAKLR